MRKETDQTMVSFLVLIYDLLVIGLDSNIGIPIKISPDLPKHAVEMGNRCLRFTPEVTFGIHFLNIPFINIDKVKFLEILNCDFFPANYFRNRSSISDHIVPGIGYRLSVNADTVYLLLCMEPAIIICYGWE